MIDYPSDWDSMANLIKELNALKAVRFTFEFEQSSSTFGGIVKVNPDLYGIAFKNGTPVDYVEPKNRTDRLNGALRHTSGDAKGSGAEVVEASPALLGERNQDIDAFVVAVLCRSKFKRIAGCTLETENISTGEPVYVATSRFDIRSDNTAHVLAGIKLNRTTSNWDLMEFNRGGEVLFWTEVADLVTNELRTQSRR